MRESRCGLSLNGKKNMTEVMFTTTHADLDCKAVSLEVLTSPPSAFRSWPGCIVIPSFSFCASGLTPGAIKVWEMECARVSPRVRMGDAVYVCIPVLEPRRTCRPDGLNVALVHSLVQVRGG